MKLLNNNQISYVLYHLHFLFESRDDVMSAFLFTKFNSDIVATNKVIFLLSESEYEHENVKWVDDIPILFPVSKRNDFYFIDKENNLIFNHDLLKSSFLLLSGFQEYQSTRKDALNRFPYEDSLQQKLNIINKPVVNYYFEIILDGLEKYCLMQNIPFKKRKLFNSFGFFLSHDIDRIDEFHFWETALKIKQLLGLANHPYNQKEMIRLTWRHIWNFMNPRVRKEIWNINFLLNTEENNNIKGTYFFLEKKGLHKNSRYRYSYKKVRDLFNKLKIMGHEIALHGTVDAAYSDQHLTSSLVNLNTHADCEVYGCRMHTLQFSSPKTMKILESVGLKYDSTLGFAAHEGFRNSYCYPFKLYDFEKDEMIHVWEFPLVVMDTTLTQYRKLSINNMKDSVLELTTEIKKFGGLFTLLWHNCHFDEIEYPGIKMFYSDLISIIAEESHSVRGLDILKMLGAMEREIKL